MGIRKWFKRVNNIQCQNPKIINLVTDWLSQQGYEFQEFSDILSMVGIKTPVTLQCLCFGKDQFSCIDNDQKYYYIEFFNEGKNVKFEVRTDLGFREFILKKKCSKNQHPVVILRKSVRNNSAVSLVSKNDIYCSEKVLSINEEPFLIVKCEKAEMKNFEEDYKIDINILDEMENYLVNLDFKNEINPEELQKFLNEKFRCPMIVRITVMKCA